MKYGKICSSTFYPTYYTPYGGKLTKYAIFLKKIHAMF